MKTCESCKAEVEAWNVRCGSCGFHLVLEPDEARRARYLRGPSIGALFFTQGWALGARLYVWFVLSLIPVVGLAVLIFALLFGRRWSWKHGGWKDWKEFTMRMKWLDILGVLWIGFLIGLYLWRRINE
jgi:hypothetical protein